MSFAIAISACNTFQWYHIRKIVDGNVARTLWRMHVKKKYHNYNIANNMNAVSNRMWNSFWFESLAPNHVQVHDLRLHFDQIETILHTLIAAQCYTWTNILPSGHSFLNVVETLGQLRLKFCECWIQNCFTNLIHLCGNLNRLNTKPLMYESRHQFEWRQTAYQSHIWHFLIARVLENSFKYFQWHVCELLCFVIAGTSFIFIQLSHCFSICCSTYCLIVVCLLACWIALLTKWIGCHTTRSSAARIHPCRS